jgi:hypothetical protein
MRPSYEVPSAVLLGFYKLGLQTLGFFLGGETFMSVEGSDLASLLGPFFSLSSSWQKRLPGRLSGLS